MQPPFFSQFDGHELEDAVGDAHVAFQFGHQFGGSLVHEAHIVAAHLLAHGVGQIAHAPVIHFFHHAVFAFHHAGQGGQDALTGLSGQLRRKEEQGFKFPHGYLLLD